jgi:hypothetical protein
MCDDVHFAADFATADNIRQHLRDDWMCGHRNTLRVVYLNAPWSILMERFILFLSCFHMVKYMSIYIFKAVLRSGKITTLFFPI